MVWSKSTRSHAFAAATVAVVSSIIVATFV